MNKISSFLKSLNWQTWLVIAIIVALIIILIVVNRKNKTVTTSTTVINQPATTNITGSRNDNFPLQQGSFGPRVGKWQTYLNSKGAKLKVDNDWGPLTDAASIKFMGFNSVAESYFNTVIK